MVLVTGGFEIGAVGEMYGANWVLRIIFANLTITGFWSSNTNGLLSLGSCHCVIRSLSAARSDADLAFSATFRVSIAILISPDAQVAPTQGARSSPMSCAMGVK